MTKATIYDAAEYLETEEDMAAYLNAAIEEGDAAIVAAALGDIARAKGYDPARAGDGAYARRPLQSAFPFGKSLVRHGSKGGSSARHEGGGRSCRLGSLRSTRLSCRMRLPRAAA